MFDVNKMLPSPSLRFKLVGSANTSADPTSLRVVQDESRQRERTDLETNNDYLTRRRSCNNLIHHPSATAAKILGAESGVKLEASHYSQANGQSSG